MFKGLICFIILVSPRTAQVVDNGSSNRNCVLPPYPEHGSYSSNIPNGSPGDSYYDFIEISVTCDQNYAVEGSAQVYCSNGWWPEPMPRCVSSSNRAPVSYNGNSNSEDKCIFPAPPDHGTYKTNIEDGKPGNRYNFLEVNVSCHQDYRVEGGQPAFCSEGWWAEPIPICVSNRLPPGSVGSTSQKPVITPKPPQPLSIPNPVQGSGVSPGRCVLPQYPEHGTYTTTTNLPNARPGTSYEIVAVNVSCHQGYVVNRPALVYCSGGQWSGEMPQCLSRCRLKTHSSLIYRCRDPVEPGYQWKFRACNEYEPEGTLVKPVCQTYYQSATTLNYMECRNGEWTNHVHKCIPQCGVLASKNELIANGAVAEYGEVPWHTGIYRKTSQPYQLICGGSLVSTNRIISAAHCFWNELTLSISPASTFVIAVGKLYRGFDNAQDQAQWSNVEAIHVPSRFRGPATNFQDDIAVLELSTVIQYRAHIRPVCVDFDDNFESRQLQPGNLGKVAGWGFTTEEGHPSQKLRTAELPYVSIKTCYSRLPPSFTMFITSDKICAGYENAGIAVCRGDSGGGLAFPEWDKGALRYYLRGVVSTAPTNDNACNTNTYTTFTRLSNHESFLTLYWRD